MHILRYILASPVEVKMSDTILLQVQHNDYSDPDSKSCSSLEGANLEAANEMFRHALELKAKGATTEAEIGFYRVLEIAPNDLNALMKLGDILFAKGDIDGAQSVWRRVVSINPRNAIAHSNLSICLCERGDWAEAEAKVRISVTIDPQNLGEIFAILDQLCYLIIIFTYAP